VCDYLNKACGVLNRFGLSVSTSQPSSDIVTGSIGWNVVKFSFAAPSSVADFKSGFQLSPLGGQKCVSFADIASTIAGHKDSRLSKSGLAQVSFCFASLALSIDDKMLRFSGSVNIYSASVPFDVILTPSRAAFAITVQLASAANAAFSALYTKITGRQADTFFTLSALSVAFSTPGFSLGASPLMAPTNGVALVPGGGLQVVATALLSTKSSNGVVQALAAVFNGNGPNPSGMSLIFTLPSAGPITIELLLPVYYFGKTKVYNAALTLSLPSVDDLKNADKVDGGNICAATPKGSFGIMVGLNVDTEIGGSPITFTGIMSAALGANVPTVSLCLGFTGTINNLFGFQKLSLTDVSGSITFMAAPPFIGGIALQGTVQINTIRISAAFSINKDITHNYAYLSLDSGLTVNDIYAAVTGSASLPAWLGSNGFGAGTYFAFSASAQSIMGRDVAMGFSTAGTLTLFSAQLKFQMSMVARPTPQFTVYVELANSVTVGSMLGQFGIHGMPDWLANNGIGAGSFFSYSSVKTKINNKDIPIGFQAHGIVTLFGWGPNVFDMQLSLSPLRASYSVQFAPINIGALSIYNDKSKSNGPNMAIVTSPFSAQASSYISCGEFSVLSSISVNTNSFHFAAQASFWGDINVDVTSDIVWKAPRSASFSATVSLNHLFSMGPAVSAMNKLGNLMPSINGAEKAMCKAAGLSHVCDDYSWMKSALTNPANANWGQIGFSVTFGGGLGAGQTAFNVKVEFTLGGKKFGPYGLTYNKGQPLSKQFAAFADKAWKDIEGAVVKEWQKFSGEVGKLANEGVAAVKQGAKVVGQDVQKGERAVGKAASSAGKAMGKAASSAGKSMGKAASSAGKFFKKIFIEVDAESQDAASFAEMEAEAELASSTQALDSSASQ